MLTEMQIREFQSVGHLTVEGMLSADELAAALDDVDRWSEEFLGQLSDDQRQWYLEGGGQQGTALRKLDNPVYHRDLFRALARKPAIVGVVEQLIGHGVSVFFSQLFMKPPELGGPKPVHQDNFYFGPDDPNATLTVWIALDDATPENGCLFYGDGSHRVGVLPHVAPEGQPFNLQVPKSRMTEFVMTAAPVAAGGISFHHGNTLHQSASNRSSSPRRAAAFHYLRNDAQLVRPALPYDLEIVVTI